MSTQAGWDRYSIDHYYQTGNAIFEEGEPADHIYVISSGRIAIIKNARTDAQLVLSYSGAGELVGELSLLTNERRTASAIAVEPSRLLAITRENFWKLFDEDWAFRHLLINELVKHILSADRSRLDAAATERALSQVMELRQATTRFIVHDLQNPLGLIKLALTMIEDETGYDPHSETAANIDSAKRSVARMMLLVDSLLDVERLSSGTFTLDLAPLDMVSLIEEVVSRNLTAAQHKNITLEWVQPTDDLPSIRADRQRIDRVLTNLIDNALKFTPLGGRITLRAHLDTDLLIVSICDTGPGIPPEQREHIFERFVQTEAGQQTRRGFGLGLAYCQSAVRAHGGNIWLEDTHDRTGSHFAFSLPRGASTG
jgi:signal transduction histidine kinase